MNRRIRIGLMIDELVDDYAQAICQGASMAAQEAGADLITIPVGGIGPESKLYINWQNVHYNTMMDFPGADILDVLIFSTGSIFSDNSKQFTGSELERFGDLPLVTIAVESENRSCVRFDNDSGIEGMVDHLVDHHGYRRIAYVSGLAGNFDSEERLSAFRSAMNRHGLDVNEDLIAYGDFSEYSRPAVEKLLDSHLNDIDAVICANDYMALIACQEIARRGKIPGRDIAVTGYDNMQWGHTMTPSLTTVAAEAADIGYQSVIEAVRLAHGSEPRTVATPTAPLLRESCGCSADGSSALYDRASNTYVAEAVEAIMAGREYANADDLATGIVARCWIRRIENVIRMIVMEAADPAAERFSVSDIISELRQALSMEIMDSDSVDTLHDLLFGLRDVLLGMVSDEEKKLQVYDLILSLQRVLSNVSSAIHYSLQFEVRRGMAVMDSVRSVVESDLDGTLMGILCQLRDMKVCNSWIYLTQEPIPVSSGKRHVMPEKLALRAFQIGDECRLLTHSEGSMARSELLRNPFIPEDGRKNMIIVPLFTYRVQYGLLLCELPHEYFSHVNSVARQISSLIETAHLLTRINEQMDQMNMRYADMRDIASRDALTGFYNRRGFFELSESIAREEANAGRRALVVFADLDNLKKINDSYGHDEGDNALILAARALQASFGPDSIIGRIGGDEFAVFDLLEDESLDKLHERLKRTLSELDEGSGYPYHVSVSAGFTDFRCNGEVVLRGYVDRADHQQYEEKKLKNTRVHKE